MAYCAFGVPVNASRICVLLILVMPRVGGATTFGGTVTTKMADVLNPVESVTVTVIVDDPLFVPWAVTKMARFVPVPANTTF